MRYDYRKEAVGMAEWCALVLDVPVPVLDYSETDQLMELKVWALADKAHNTILLNAELLNRMPDRVGDVICHEMAHLACPVHGHGKEWTSIVDRLLG